MVHTKFKPAKSVIVAVSFLVVTIASLLGCSFPGAAINIPQTTPVSSPATSPSLSPTISTQTPAPTLTPSTTPPRSSAAPAPTGELQVHFIDVGQGDSIFLDLGDTEVLIDAGEASPGVTDFIKKKYIDGPLEVVVATHPHADHIGGLPAVLNAFKVLDIWDNGESSTTATYDAFIASVKGSGAIEHVGKRGDVISAGALSFTVLNPVNIADTTNNNSLVLSLSYGEIKFLFTGDAEKEAEAGMLAAGIIPCMNILKVGHHASRTASSAPFLAAARPETAVYMAGTGNRYGHPHQETLDALSQIGAKIYGTDVNGTIAVTSDGNNYIVTP